MKEFECWYNYDNCEFCILEKDLDGKFHVSSKTPLKYLGYKTDYMNIDDNSVSDI